MTHTPHIEERKDHGSEETVQRPDESLQRPDLTPPPSSPEPDHEALEQGLERLEAVKPY